MIGGLGVEVGLGFDEEVVTVDVGGRDGVSTEEEGEEVVVAGGGGGGVCAGCCCCSAGCGVDGVCSIARPGFRGKKYFVDINSGVNFGQRGKVANGSYRVG